MPQSSYVWHKQRQQVTEDASCPLFLPCKHIGSWPLFPEPAECTAAHLYFLCDCKQGDMLHVAAWKQNGWHELAMWLSDASVWYFPRKPIKDSSLSRWWKCGSSRGCGGWQQEPQMVSLPSCCRSDIPCPTAPLACANYLGLEYAFVRTFVVWGGLLVCKLWCLNFVFFVCIYFWRATYIMLMINLCLLKGLTVMIYSQVYAFAKWSLGKSFLSMWLKRACEVVQRL